MRAKTSLRGLAVLLLANAMPAMADTTQLNPQAEPFRIAGNLYWVGSVTHGAFLIATPKGLILINSNYPNSPPLIRQSVKKLGFRWRDIKILLISHAHIDHDGGSAQVVKETGAKYEVMAPDVDVVESGGKTDFYYGQDASQYYPPAHVDRVLHDGDTVTLGGVTLTAHLTPGHTKGTTTWTFDEAEGGKTLHVVLMGGPTLNRDVNLLDNPRYPGIAADYRKGFDAVRALPSDVPLGPHDWYFGLADKLKRLNAGDKAAFVEPAGCKTFVDKSQAAFEALIVKERALVAEGKPPGR